MGDRREREEAEKVDMESQLGRQVYDVVLNLVSLPSRYILFPIRLDNPIS